MSEAIEKMRAEIEINLTCSNFDALEAGRWRRLLLAIEEEMLKLKKKLDEGK